MIKPFKFFQGRPKRLYHYDLLVGGMRVEVLNSNEPLPNYDSQVINIVRRHMNRGLPWRGHQLHVFEPDGYPLLKIVSGINIGGMFQILYLITRDGNTERHNVSVPLVNLQRRG